LQDLKLQNLLKVNILIGHRQSPYTALLDSGADKNCVSEGFCNFSEVTIEKNTVEDTVIAANGERLKVLGEVKIPFSWVCPNGATNSAKFPFYVVEDLQVGMLICERYIAHLRLKGLPLVAPVLLASRSPKAKLQDMQRTQQAIANAKVREAEDAAQRKAERKVLPPKCLSRNSSMAGGSDTTAVSRSSSLTGGSSASSASSA
jgi:hypothetical protein